MDLPCSQHGARPRHLTRPATTPRLALTALATCLAASLVLTACGGSSSTTTVPATGASTTTSSSSPSASGQGLSVRDAWAKATAGTSDTTMTSAFMTIFNDTSKDVTLVSATSPSAPKVEIHEVVVLNGKTVMQPATNGVPVPAGGFAPLMPGSYHVMLMGLTKPLAVGDEVAITLTFSDGESLAVTAPVKEFTEDMQHYHTGSSTPAPTSSMSPSMSGSMPGMTP